MSFIVAKPCGRDIQRLEIPQHLAKKTFVQTIKKHPPLPSPLLIFFFFFFDKRADILSQRSLSTSSENKFEIKHLPGALKLQLHLDFSTYSLLNSVFFFLKELLQDTFMKKVIGLLCLPLSNKAANKVEKKSCQF